MFSTRTSWVRDENALSARAAEMKGDPELVDLTVSNPTIVGIERSQGLLSALSDRRALAYGPDPLGLAEARDAVAAYYARRNVHVDPARIVLTSTTSEAYAFLFQLLLERGAHVAAPTPSYPLFSFLADLAGVEIRHYELLRGERWTLDSSTLADAQAVIVVSPNNPTGSVLAPGERSEILAHARRSGASVIADEVFLDYLAEPKRFAATTFVKEQKSLTFTLSGLSKVAGLPQMKLSWIVVSGPDEDAGEALSRLTIIADTFLSVSTPVQLAAPAFLEDAEAFQDRLRARLAVNRRALPPNALTGDGGWYAIIPLDPDADDEAFALDLLERQRVLVHPGYFFDLIDPAIVVSLLPQERVFAATMRRMFGG
jgi:hypothetical protein